MAKKEGEFETIDTVYLDFREIALSTDPLFSKINKLKNPSIQTELSIRLKRVQIELLTSLEFLGELSNCDDEVGFEKVVENFVEKG